MSKLIYYLQGAPAALHFVHCVIGIRAACVKVHPVPPPISGVKAQHDYESRLREQIFALSLVRFSIIETFLTQASDKLHHSIEPSMRGMNCSFALLRIGTFEIREKYAANYLAITLKNSSDNQTRRCEKIRITEQGMIFL